MATEAVQAVMERCDPAHLHLYDGEGDRQDGYEADVVVSHLIEGRRVNKVWCTKLRVLDDMMSLLESLESPHQLLNEPCPPKPETGAARGSWKALKAEYRESQKGAESLIGSLQSKVEQLHLKRARVTELVHTLEEKREQSEQLKESLQKARTALRACEGQLTRLRAETEAVLTCLDQWQLCRDELLQGYVSAAQGVMQYAVSVSQSELCLELRPRLCGSSASSGPLELLKLSVTWTDDARFCLKVYQGGTGALEEQQSGRLPELSAALLDIVERHGEMLAEVQNLQSRFAIDWRAGQRQLVYLKRASVVCTLAVGRGYPSTGRATLLSVRRDAQPVDPKHLQHHKKFPSLTDWLEFLFLNPHV